MSENCVCSSSKHEESSVVYQGQDKQKYEVIDLANIRGMMDECVEEVNAIIDMPKSTIKSLLRYYKWDKHKVMEEICDQNEEKLFKKVGIVGKKKMNEDETNSRVKRFKNCTNDGKQIECQICLLQVSPTDLFSAGCEHSFCKRCWEKYLSMKIIDLGEVNEIKCPDAKCTVITDEDDMIALLNNEETKKKYRSLLIKAFVDSSRFLRWCPTVDCNHAIKVESIGPQNVRCVCGYEMCFNCGEITHDPIECVIMKAWVKKAGGSDPNSVDGQTASWLGKHTKDCPKCQTRIERSSGCNHMTCRSKTCKYEFCWICLGAWSTHGRNYYTCNKFTNKTEDENSKSDDRKALERYMFYWDRYASHQLSFKFEKNLIQKVDSKMRELQETYRYSWIELQFLPKAVNVLLRCRQTLSITYVFAYYTVNNFQMNIFENNQIDLQNEIEKLSEYLERKLPKVKDPEMTRKVQDLANYCETRRNTLIEHILEGYEKDWWSYIV